VFIHVTLLMIGYLVPEKSGHSSETEAAKLS
jgi:hypothetical protein